MAACTALIEINARRCAGRYCPFVKGWRVSDPPSLRLPPPYPRAALGAALFLLLRKVAFRPTVARWVVRAKQEARMIRGWQGSATLSRLFALTGGVFRADAAASLREQPREGRGVRERQRSLGQSEPTRGPYYGTPAAILDYIRQGIERH